MLNPNIVTAIYIASSVLFILSLGGLSNQEKAKRAVWFGIIGMSLAVFATVFGPQVSGFGWIVPMIILGSVIGAYVAQRVEMTVVAEGGRPVHLVPVHRVRDALHAVAPLALVAQRVADAEAAGATDGGVSGPPVRGPPAQPLRHGPRLVADAALVDPGGDGQPAAGRLLHEAGARRAAANATRAPAHSE